MNMMKKSDMVELKEKELQDVVGGDGCKYETVRVNEFVCPTCDGDLVFEGFGTIQDWIFEEPVQFFRCSKCGTLYRKDMCNHWVKITY